MNIQDIHTLLDFYLDKAGQGYLSPAEKDAALHQGQLELFEERKPAYGANQQLHDSLRPFRKKQILTNSTTPNGLITFNPDYLHLLSIELNVLSEGKVDYLPVELVNDDEAAWRKSSSLVPPAKYPFCRDDEGGKVQLFPEQAVAGTLYYLSTPVKPKFGFTQSGRTITYDPTTSVQLAWNETDQKRVIGNALKICGISLNDIAAVQFAEKEAAN